MLATARNNDAACAMIDEYDSIVAKQKELMPKIASMESSFKKPMRNNIGEPTLTY